MTRTDTFLEEINTVLKENILDFWMNRMTDPSGGFYGRVSGNGVLDADAPKGAVLNARILWTFAAAYRIFHDEKYLQTATRAKEYVLEHFIDHKYGGVYWTLKADGSRLDTKKQFYALSFVIYGLSEYYMATRDDQALRQAINLYQIIEKESLDPVDGGYIEATTRDWKQIGDMRLSEKDDNEKKTMNTHLHILEAYTNLYKAWKDPGLKKAIINLLDIFSDRIYIPETGHLGLFFDEHWNSKNSGISYGHEIETSWLLMEAAFTVGDIDVINKVTPISYKTGIAAMEGLQPDGSMIYEKHKDGNADKDRHWWVQAETVTGSLWLWRYSSFQKGADIALRCWSYIKGHLIDMAEGEWFWSCHDNGTANVSDDKAGLWKCPYHNSRMCFEVIRILQGNEKASY